MDLTIHVDMNHKMVKVNGVEINFSNQSMVLFFFLCINRKEWHERKLLIEKVWPDVHRVPRVVDQAVLAINKKVSAAVPLGKTKIIISLLGRGYRLNDDFKVYVAGDKSVLPNNDDPITDLTGQYQKYNNKKIIVEVLGVASHNQVNFVIFKDKKQHHILPNSEFFAAYKKI